ncbi:hypothetical protein SAMN04487910_0356 [Aquimarina amphilecti]|uniref:Uncharacterized protein n=1 Tax=Aquimarina amphilecti TaxID=1038014 RepID=A0A1H7GI83_AQUAM|nr:hypothetical protein [Aquimarina amphilecti]SEK36672.1 hypothetical protein SAMN04487910_0356 [Aquimarina amphilecti]
MASLFHLLFELIRIPILSFIYGAIIWLVINKILKYKGLKKRFLIPLICITFFIWRFSYWRNNGMGDYGRVPITSDYQLEMIDFSNASLDKNGVSKITSIDELYKEGNLIYIKGWNEYEIFNIENEMVKENLTESEFVREGGNLNKLMSSSEFHSQHWGLLTLLFL